MSKSSLGYFLLSVFFTALYLFTHFGIHTYDALAFVRILEHPTPEAIFNPHHLFSHAAMLGADHLFRFFGYHGDYFFPAQLLSTIAAMTALLCFYAFMLEATQEPTLSALVSANLGVSFGFWFDAVEIEVYSLTLAVLMIALLGILKSYERPSAWKVLGLSALIGLAGCFHQMSFFFSLAFAGTLLVHSRLGKGKKVWFVILIGAGVFTFGILPYFAVGHFLLGYKTLREIFWWMTMHAHVLSGGDIKKFYFFPFGIFETFFGHYFVDTLRAGKPTLALLFLLALPGILFLEFLRRVLSQIHFGALWSYERERGAFAVTLLTVLIFGAFVTWWSPYEFELWQSFLPFFWGLVGVILYVSPQEKRRAKAEQLLALSFIVLFAVNLFGSVIPYRNLDRDPEYRQARTLSRLSGRRDLFLVGSGNVEHYLPIFFDRDRVKTIHNLALKHAKQNEFILSDLRSLMKEAIKEKNKILICEEAINVSQGILHLHNLSRSELNEFWKPYYPSMRQVGTYRGLSMERTLGFRSGYRSYRIFELTELPDLSLARTS